MNITTKWNFGEVIIIDGKRKIVRGIHIYISERGIQTERYYLGNSEWYTIQTREASE